MSQVSGAPQPSTECLLQGFFLLNLRVTDTAEQVFYITSVRSQLSFSGHFFLKRRAGLSLSFQRKGP